MVPPLLAAPVWLGAAPPAAAPEPAAEPGAAVPATRLDAAVAGFAAADVEPVPTFASPQAPSAVAAATQANAAGSVRENHTGQG